MDLREHLPLFLAECREHLLELNLAVVRIEENPRDRDTVNEIFRVAHSLKAMSAAMGFDGMAVLTHEMEDAFELLRQRSTPLPQAAIDLLLECLDALDAAIESIDATGQENLAPEPLARRLKTLVRARTEAQERERSGSSVPLPDLRAVDPGNRRVLRASVTLAAQALMPSVRAYMVLEALREHGEILASAPSPAGLLDFRDRDIEAWLASEHEEAAIAADVLAVSEVESATVAEPEFGARGAAPAGAEAAREAPTDGGGHRKAASVRVDAARLDELIRAMGELVVHRTRVESLAADARIPDLAEAVQDLTRSSQALQAMVMQVRMVPVEAAFQRVPRLVRDLSIRLGKEVALVVRSEETELDRTVVDALGDPLVHLVRNALDHGLEPGDERVAAGKPRQGTLTISACHAGGDVVIGVADDGRGIDPAAVAAKAVDRGLIAAEAAAGLDAAGAAELLFAPGFSTVAARSEISGRGVGLDAVRTIVRGLGGEVTLTSEPGRGAAVQVRIPLALAIMPVLLGEAGGLPVAIPLGRVQATVRLAGHAVQAAAGSRTLVLRGRELPLIDASAAVGHTAASDPGGDEHVVVVRGADGEIALALTRLIGERELMTTALPSAAADGAAASRGAVLADGGIALVVDCDALSPMAAATTPVPA